MGANRHAVARMRNQRLSKCALYLLAVFVSFVSSISAAEQKISQGDLDVHYITFNSRFLTAKIANRYGLKRGDNTGILSISVRLREEDGSDQAVAATLEGVLINLLSQRQKLQFQEIREPGAFYYLASFRFTTDEAMRFDLTVKAAGQVVPLQFQTRLYPE